MKRSITYHVKIFSAYLLLFFFVYLFLFAEFNRTPEVPSSVLNVLTIFLSVVLEAFPFILLGVLLSALIQTFVSEEMIRKIVPKNPLLAIGSISFVGLIFPVCECAIIPVVRRLVKKGVPLYVGVVFLAAVPIINPVVILSTYYAFSVQPEVIFYRVGFGWITAILIGVLFYAFMKKGIVKSPEKAGEITTNHEGNRLVQVLRHASDEFFDTGKYLLFGALLASLFQTFLDRDLLGNLTASDVSGSLLLMGLAYVLSICSEADAFIASSFKSHFSVAPIVAFLVYGPMVDLKNTIMLYGFFPKRVASIFILAATLIVFSLVIIIV